MNEHQYREVFLETLGALLRAGKHYQKAREHLLMHIAFGNGNELGDRFGASHASKKMQIISGHLASGLRGAVVFRNGAGCWILTPESYASSKSACSKAKEIINDSNHGDIHAVDKIISIFRLTSIYEISDIDFLIDKPLRALEYLLRNKHKPSLPMCQCIFTIADPQTSVASCESLVFNKGTTVIHDSTNTHG